MPDCIYVCMYGLLHHLVKLKIKKQMIFIVFSATRYYLLKTVWIRLEGKTNTISPVTSFQRCSGDDTSIYASYLSIVNCIIIYSSTYNTI